MHRWRPSRPCVIVKHANPCGVAVADDITDAYVAAHACDPVSAFGGIVAVNRPVHRAVAEALAPVFTEVVVAPAFEDGALERAAPRRRTCASSSAPPPGGRGARPARDRRWLPGAEAPTPSPLDRPTWQVVTKVAADRRAVGRPRAGLAGRAPR